jgi:hypothetical protein
MSHEQTREGYITMTTDSRLAIQFASKKEAINAAKSIGWRVSDAYSIEVMGFKLWTIANEHCQYLTKTGYAYARHLRGLESGWTPPQVSQEDIARVLAR